MPKQTFYNLPEEKRNRIVEVAIEEFSSYSYTKSSINRIVKQSDIAKGSFYQYFEDKLDLYQHVLACIAEEKMAYMQAYTKELTSGDFFDYLKATYSSGIAFAMENPLFAKIGLHLMKEDESTQELIMGDLQAKGEHYLKNMIVNAQQQGSIRDSIDPEFLAFVINKLNFASIEYLKKDQFGASFYSNYESFSQAIIDLIKNGIKKVDNEG
jgi:AcrR family transcriptional regulator